MAGFVIGKKLSLGAPGMLTRQHDNQINAYPNVGKNAIAFGSCVVREGDGVRAFKSTDTADKIIGVALRIVKTNNTYGENDPQYNHGDAVDVLTRGSVAVVCKMDGAAVSAAPVAGGKVYVRTATGEFVAAADSSNTVELTDVVWASSNRDADGMAEITLLKRKA